MTVAEKIDKPIEQEAASTDAVLEGRYSVDFSRRLADLESSANTAVLANDLQDSSSECFAVISSPYSTYRQSLAQLMSESCIPGMVELLAHGSIRTSDTDACYVSIFEMPRGGLLYRDGSEPLTENMVFDRVLPAVVDCLQILHKNKLAHRGIRANNIFFADLNREHLLLGEPVTSAPGSAQPVVYEPITSAMAHPMGRGEGTPADDIYAVGVLILHLLCGKLPAAELSASEIYKQKLEFGSFAALTEGISLSSRVKDVLAGLLHDDPKRRWDVATLARWRDAIADPPRRGRGDSPAFGKILFESEEYNSPRLLAYAMAQNQKAALELIESGRLTKWINGSLRDETIAKKMVLIYEGGTLVRSEKHYAHTAVARAIHLLDPDGACWYRDIVFGRGALGSLMLSAFQDDNAELKKTIAELLETNLMHTIAVNEVRTDKERNAEWMPASSISNCNDYMKQKQNIGFGLERCLYALNPGSPCLSPLVLGGDVRNIPQLIDVAEKKLSSSNGQGNPFDRHIAAFVAVKSKGLDKHLKILAHKAPGSAEQMLVQLRILAKLQAAAHPLPLPGFCRWTEEMLKPVFAKIRSRLRREIVSQKFHEAKKSGSMVAILNATDIERQLAADAREYDEALAVADEGDRIAVYLEKSVEQRRTAAMRYGAWITSVLAITSLMSSMILSALYFLE